MKDEDNVLMMVVEWFVDEELCFKDLEFFVDFYYDFIDDDCDGVVFMKVFMELIGMDGLYF